MDKQKSSKKKFITAICCMCAAFLGVMGALIGVLAASSQSVNSSFSVNYDVGDNIAIKISSSYIYTGENHYDYTGPEELTELYSIQYNANNTSEILDADGNIIETLPTHNATLSIENRVIHYFWEIKNLNSNAIMLDINWDDLTGYYLGDVETETIENCAFFYIDSDVIGYLDIGEYSDVYFGEWQYDGNMCTLENTYFSILPATPISIAGNSSFVISIAIGVDDINRSAYCISEGESGLTFTFTDADVYAG